MSASIDVGEIWWLYKTAAAACCWATSDVICDTCIGSSNPTHSKSDSHLNGSIHNSRGEAARGTSNGRNGHAEKDATPHRNGHSARSCITPQADKNLRHRPPALSLERSSSADPGHFSPRSRGSSGSALQKDNLELFTFGQLSPEQNALVSGFVSLFIAALSWLYFDVAVDLSIATAVAVLAGVFHFVAYLTLLLAFATISSTVTTPLMQLSAVWMLPFSTLAAILGHGEFFRPVHLLSVLLVCAGGFLPAAGGVLSLLFTRAFWEQKGVQFVIVSELLICIYNLILHQMTFMHPDMLQNAPQQSGGVESYLSTLRFIIISNISNGLTCIILFLALPSLRQHACSMRRVNKKFLVMSCAGECLSVIGIIISSFSYSSFYEPSVVNAAEGGLQQLTNLLLAVASHRFFGWGRAVDNVYVKIVSFMLVSMGLFLSTL